MNGQQCHAGQPNTIKTKAVFLLYYRLYQLLGWLVFLAGLLPCFLYIAVSGRYRQGISQRFGFLEKAGLKIDRRTRIWLHAASVGEVQVARSLVAEFSKVSPGVAIVLSTVTEQGYQVAKNQLGTEVSVVYAPLDLAGIVKKALRSIRPSVYICLETELWPNILHQVYKQGIRLVLLNGRMSERSYRRYRLVRKFMRDLLSKFSLLAVIQPADAERYIGLGADPDKLSIKGNAKYDLAVEHCPEATEVEYRTKLGLSNNQPLLVAGSTHTGEEEMLVDSFLALKATKSGKELIWVVAPRHLNRLQEVTSLFKAKGLVFDRWSEVKERGRETDIVLVDEMGELTNLYSVATYVFCGGSLVPRGGHNIMEAAVCGKPVFYGPNMKDFADAAELLESGRAGFPIGDQHELTESILYFMDHQQEYREAAGRAREIALAQRGSAREQVRLVMNLLET